MSVESDSQITDLGVDDHACLSFGEPDELFDLTAAFIRDGLATGLRVLVVSDSAPAQSVAELARRGITAEAALAAGQLVALPCEGSLLHEQAFSADRAMQWLRGMMAACRDGALPGLRVAMDMAWALRPVAGVEQLPEFEKYIAAALGGTAVSVLCQYDRERFDPVTIASVAAVHTRSVAAATYYHDALLRICRQYAPPGIRLAGELDFHAEDPLACALAEAIRLDGDITVNMTRLRFIDVFCTRMLLNAARSLPAPRRVIVQCAPAIARRFGLMGADDIPDLSMVTVVEP